MPIQRLDAQENGSCKASARENISSVQPVARRMTSLDGGVILMIAPTNGLAGYRNRADHGASKPGVIPPARSIGQEHAPRTRGHAICPRRVTAAVQRGHATRRPRTRRWSGKPGLAHGASP